MQTNIDPRPNSRGLTAISGAMSLIAVLLIVQIWLLSAALEAFLAGKRHTAVPAAIFSGLMFLVCFGLYLFVNRVDADVRHSNEER
jgi:predicted Co/Zn/Cd cation transporter (cation efflux family)